MKLQYDTERYKDWIKLKDIIFQRKLENETAFDGIIKIYSLKSSIESLNLKLAGKYFGEFNYESNCGIFLRMFESKNSWPETTLIHIDLRSFNFTEIKNTNSSWNVWKGYQDKSGMYFIEISPTEKVSFKTN